MSLCMGVSTILIKLLTYCLVLLFLFGCDDLVRGISSWLSDKVAVVSGSSSSSIKKSVRTIATMSRRSFLVTEADPWSLRCRDDIC